MSTPVKRHPYIMGLIAHLAAAMVTGAACVLFARIFEWARLNRLDFTRVGGWAFLIFPIGFLLSVELIRRTAPFASGTGIPQAIFAAEHIDRENEPLLFPMVSPWTMTIKIVSLIIAVMAGASTGREGPTVHVAVCVFFLVLMVFRKFLKVDFDPRSAIIAGAAAGLAAAFNTPLAGVTFAVEELCESYFASIKDIVLMSIIVAAVTAQILTGEYSYFGHLNDPVLLPMRGILIISLASGGMGLFFGWLLYRGAAYLRGLKIRHIRYGLPVIMGLGVALLAVLAGVRTLGPGNIVAHQLLNGFYEPWVNSFAPAKMATTLMTYWAGLSGGIFAPCLSMGAGIGATLAHWWSWPIATCALIGMAAFLSGAIQAPMTSFVILYEMSGHHTMLLPLMLASLTPFLLARLLGIKPLYKLLASAYAPLFPQLTSEIQRVK